MFEANYRGRRRNRRSNSHNKDSEDECGDDECEDQKSDVPLIPRMVKATKVSAFLGGRQILGDSLVTLTGGFLTAGTFRSRFTMGSRSRARGTATARCGITEAS